MAPTKQKPVPQDSLPKPRYGGREGSHSSTGHLERNDSAGRPLYVTDAVHVRAATIFDGVVERARLNGFELNKLIEGWQRGTFLEKDGFRIEILVRESTRQTAVTGSRWDSKYTYVPSGQLVFQARPGSGASDKQWKDGDRKIEERLDEIAAAIEKQHADMLAWETERADKARAEAESRRQEEAEDARFDELVRQVESWELSHRIRAFVDEAERGLLEVHGRIDTGSEVAAWLQWARRRAELADPLRRIP